MNKEEILWTASIAFAKNISCEDLKYSDYMYGKEDLTDRVWEYVEEIKQFGRVAFYDKYKEFRLY